MRDIIKVVEDNTNKDQMHDLLSRIVIQATAAMKKLDKSDNVSDILDMLDYLAEDSRKLNDIVIKLMNKE